MKFYNPFKPHIAKVDDTKYAIRRHFVFYWLYLDRDNFAYWWGLPEYVRKYCVLNSESEAIKLLDRYYRRKKIISEFYSKGSNK